MNEITTRAEGNFVYICEDDVHGQPVQILKAYLSADHKKLRVFLPELVDFTQTRIRPDVHIVDFDRESAKGKR